MMRFGKLTTLALLAAALPIVSSAAASAQASAPQNLQARVTEPRLLPVSAAAPAAAAPAPAAGVSLPPTGFHDLVRATLNSDVRDTPAIENSTLEYTFYGTPSSDSDPAVSLPKLTHIVGRNLPASSLQSTAQRVAAVRVLVNAAGVPTDAMLVRSTGDASVDRATLAAVEQYRFAPARVHGLPVDADMTVQVRLARR